MSLICDESHLCFGKETDSAHKTSHLCFGKRYRAQLEPLEAHATASVLEGAVDQLAILGKTLPKVEEGRDDDKQGFQDVDARFGKPPPSPRVFPEMAGRWPPDVDAMLKVQRDCLFAEVVLNEVLAELCEKGSFGCLRTSLDWQGVMVADEHKLVERHEEGLEKRRELLHQIASDRRNMLDQRAFWEKKTDHLTSNLHDTYLTGGLTISYAESWEHNRREQQGLVLSRNEDTLHDAIEHLQDPEGPNEDRVHTEVMRFLAKDIEVLKKNLDHWTDLYDAEMMQRETENMQLRSALEQQSEEHRELQAEECRMKQIMKDATILRAQYEEKEKIICSVVAIQAWWRGVSFRAGIKIGQIKKNKKGKKKRKAKGGIKGSKTKGKLKKY
ncbi:hypothetical protein ONE63_006754 [Megalurothrips usitatus]|nr:hypothetical protein ONE63_006754 [Megalurothrips usitatus]